MAALAAPSQPLVHPGFRRNRCQILLEDRDLAAAVRPEFRAAATDRCIAATVTVPAGRWKSSDMALLENGLGLLVLDGVLVRRVGVDGRFGAELLGGGDLLRPWQGEDVDLSLPATSGWRVLEPARLALLDERATVRMAPFPGLLGALTGRAVARARTLALMMAVVHQPRTHVRIHMLLWHLADRWGRVRLDGVLVPLRLTRNVLAELVAARRPSVTLALGRLSEEGLVEACDGGWLLHGERPGELLELGGASVPAAPSALDG